MPECTLSPDFVAYFRISKSFLYDFDIISNGIISKVSFAKVFLCIFNITQISIEQSKLQCFLYIGFHIPLELLIVLVFYK